MVDFKLLVEPRKSQDRRREEKNETMRSVMVTQNFRAEIQK